VATAFAVGRCRRQAILPALPERDQGDADAGPGTPRVGGNCAEAKKPERNAVVVMTLICSSEKRAASHLVRSLTRSG